MMKKERTAPLIIFTRQEEIELHAGQLPVRQTRFLHAGAPQGLGLPLRSP